MNKIIGIILIFGGLALGYIGINQIADSTSSFKFLGIKIEASNDSGEQKGIIYLGIAVLLFAGGIYTLGRAKK